MKRPSAHWSLLIGALWLAIPYRLNAGQVITPELEAWARQVATQEAAIGVQEGERTLAVLPFVQEAGDTAFSPLEKGLAVMVATDLSKVGSLAVVDRVRVQALMQELALSRSGLLQEDTAPRMGRFLRARWVVGGAFGVGEGRLAVRSPVFETPRALVLGQPTGEALVKEIFRIEKDLVQAIVELLRITPTPAEEEALRKPLTLDFDALMAFSRGLDASDRGLYEEAATQYREAIGQDPGLGMAQDALGELETLHLIEPPRTAAAGDLLKDLRAETSLVDTLFSETATMRLGRASDTVERHVDGGPGDGFANLPPWYVGP